MRAKVAVDRNGAATLALASVLSPERCRGRIMTAVVYALLIHATHKFLAQTTRALAS
jgi:hypothetical protein